LGTLKTEHARGSTARYIQPMLLQLVPKLPEGEHWQYEVKWDGFRGVAVVNRGTARLWSRNERDLGKRFPSIAEALGSVPAKSAVIDGELVVLGDDGKPSFQALQYFDPAEAGQLFFYAFDLLHLDGMDLMGQPLAQRRAMLAELMGDVAPALRFSSTLEGTPDALVPLLREQGLEGIVAKDSRSIYEPGKRTGKWQKFKLYLEAEFLIGGFIPSGQGGIESVVLGKRDGGKLVYVACLDVRMPRTDSWTAAKKLNALRVKECPFPQIPKRKPGNSWSGGMTEQEINTAVWVQPKHKAEVNFLEWTRGGFLRHAQVKSVSIE
jgi:bifunctional non-homologous end joining protein LigD